MNTDERYLQEARELFDGLISVGNQCRAAKNYDSIEPAQVQVIANELRRRDAERDANIFCEWKIVDWQTDGPELELLFKNGLRLKTKVSEEDAEDWWTDVWEECSDDCEKAGLVCDEDRGYQFASDDAPTRWRPFSGLRKNMIEDYVTLRTEADQKGAEQTEQKGTEA